MGVAKFVVSVSADTILPRDRVINTLYVNDTIANEFPGSTDGHQLADDLLTIYDTQFSSQVTSRERSVKVYGLGAPPQFPIAEVTRNSGVGPPATPIPREVALCLSYDNTPNLPRPRGRSDVPAWWLTTSPGNRPATTEMQKLMDLAAAFGNLGGVDIDWSVHSKVAGTTEKVTNYWVDDEWDTQRRRGLKATRRLTATTSE